MKSARLLDTLPNHTCAVDNRVAAPTTKWQRKLASPLSPEKTCSTNPICIRHTKQETPPNNRRPFVFRPNRIFIERRRVSRGRRLIAPAEYLFARGKTEFWKWQTRGRANPPRLLMLSPRFGKQAPRRRSARGLQKPRSRKRLIYTIFRWICKDVGGRKVFLCAALEGLNTILRLSNGPRCRTRTKGIFITAVQRRNLEIWKCGQRRQVLSSRTLNVTSARWCLDCVVSAVYYLAINTCALNFVPLIIKEQFIEYHKSEQAVKWHSVECSLKCSCIIHSFAIGSCCLRNIVWNNFGMIFKDTLAFVFLQWKISHNINLKFLE